MLLQPLGGCGKERLIPAHEVFRAYWHVSERYQIDAISHDNMASGSAGKVEDVPRISDKY